MFRRGKDLLPAGCFYKYIVKSEKKGTGLSTLDFFVRNNIKTGGKQLRHCTFCVTKRPRSLSGVSTFTSEPVLEIWKEEANGGKTKVNR